ncbi:hypothetical protein B0H14DRAFT_3493342 [Mycena olivaceomarginata]|nr:hypothetical protein B0H14DRAFT_3493342 [Mycena olivaceomarginata]
MSSRPHEHGFFQDSPQNVITPLRNTRIHLPRPAQMATWRSSFIATVNAAVRYRVLVVQTLRSLAREAEQLRGVGVVSSLPSFLLKLFFFIVGNEWRVCACVPQLDVLARSDTHNAVLRAELEDFGVHMGMLMGVLVGVAQGQPRYPVMDFTTTTSLYAPARSYLTLCPAIPRLSRSYAAERERGVGPGIPPSSVGMHMLHPVMMGRKGYTVYEGAGTGAGVVYDLGLGFDGEEGLLVTASHGACAAAQISA